MTLGGTKKCEGRTAGRRAVLEFRAAEARLSLSTNHTKSTNGLTFALRWAASLFVLFVWFVDQ